MSRIVSDLMDISELAHHGPEDLFVSGVMLIGSFVMMATIHLPLTLIVFAALPAMVLFASHKQRKMSAAFTATRVEIGEINAGLENSISGIRVSKAYTSRAYENEQFERGNQKYVTVRAKAYKVMAEFFAGTTVIGDILNVLLYVAGGLFCYLGEITAGDFAAFLIYISLFMNPVRRIVNFIEQYQNGMTGFKRFLEIVDYPPEEDAPDAAEMGEVRGEIRFDNVDFSYTEDGRRVLSAHAVREMQTPQCPYPLDGQGSLWGLGVRVACREGARLPVGCFGWSGAYGGHFWVDPANRIVALYLKNSHKDGGSEAKTGKHFEEDVYGL
jgi:ATP-binding cassette subfamily B protein